MAWLYEIHGTDGCLVRRESGFNTKEEAAAAADRYRHNNKAKFVRPEDPDEIFIVTFGQELMGGSPPPKA